MSGLLRRSPLVSFLILSCALSWWPAALQAAGAQMPGPPLTGIGPFLAAMIVLGATQGRAGATRLLRSMVHWRVPARAYLAGLGLPPLVSGVAVLATLAIGGARPDRSDLATWTNIPVLLLVVLLIPGLGGAWEEPGWRGYALGRLEAKFGTLAGPLILGAVFHSAGNSVLIAMIFHATNNAVGGGYASQLFTGSDQIILGLLTAAGWWSIAFWLLIRATCTDDATS